MSQIWSERGNLKTASKQLFDALIKSEYEAKFFFI